MTLAGAAPPGGRRAAAREEVAARAGDDPGVRGGGAPVVVQRVDVVGREAARVAQPAASWSEVAALRGSAR